MQRFAASFTLITPPGGTTGVGDIGDIRTPTRRAKKGLDVRLVVLVPVQTMRGSHVTMTAQRVQMKIKRISILTGRGGPDSIGLEVEGLTRSFPKSTEPTYFMVHAEAGYGETWAKENFPGVETEVVKL